MLQDHPADDEIEGKLRIAGGLQGNVANLVASFHRLVGGMRRGLDPLHLPACARHPVEEVAGRNAEFQQPPGRRSRTEEHTSELQSLMRLSYAVFCLKKKK